MKNNFSQSFKVHTSASLVIEVEEGFFLQFNADESSEESYSYPEHYARIPELELNVHKDIPLQLAKFLHELGLALVEYRELAQTTSVSYSLIDKTPGEALTDICFYVRADRTEKEIPHAAYETVDILALDMLLNNLERSFGGYTSVIHLGLQRLQRDLEFLQ